MYACNTLIFAPFSDLQHAGDSRMEGRRFGSNEHTEPEHIELHDMKYHGIEGKLGQDKEGAPIELDLKKNYQSF